MLSRWMFTGRHIVDDKIKLIYFVEADDDSGVALQGDRGPSGVRGLKGDSGDQGPSGRQVPAGIYLLIYLFFFASSH